MFLCIPRPALSLCLSPLLTVSLFLSLPLCFVYYVPGLYFMCWLPPVSLFMAFNPTRTAVDVPPTSQPPSHSLKLLYSTRYTDTHSRIYMRLVSMCVCFNLLPAKMLCSVLNSWRYRPFLVHLSFQIFPFKWPTPSFPPLSRSRSHSVSASLSHFLNAKCCRRSGLNGFCN